MTTLRAMGEGEPETFRCRVYGDDSADIERRSFYRTLATLGVVETEGNWQRLEAMAERGWVVGELEPNPDGEGRIKRWRVTDVGRREFAEITGERL